jgi:hypothetical protein
MILDLLWEVQHLTKKPVSDPNSRYEIIQESVSCHPFVNMDNLSAIAKNSLDE